MTTELWTFDEIGRGTLFAALRRRPIALVGAGSSRSVGYPGWAELLSLLTEEAAVLRPDASAELDSARAMPDLAVRAAMLQRVVGPEAYHAFLRRTFGPDDTAVGSLPRAIVRLPFRHVLTTNYDAVLESTHLALCGQRPHRVVHSHRAAMSEFLRNIGNDEYARRYVYLHGRFDEPSSIILTEYDYRDHYLNTNRAREELFAILATQTVVSIGFSLTDTDVMASFRFITGAYAGSGPHHVAILPPPDGMPLDVARVFFKEKFGIDAVFYPVDGRDHSQLVTLLSLAAEENPAPALAPSAPQAVTALISRLEREVGTAFKAFTEEDFSSAEMLFESLLLELERLVGETPGDAALQRLASRARLGRSSVYLSNSDPNAAAALVRRVDRHALDIRGDRIRLLRHLIRVGDLEQAESCLKEEDDDQDLIPVRQYLQLKRGHVQPTPARVDWLLIETGAFHLGEGRLAEAVACATEAKAVTDRTLVKAGALQILVASLLGSATGDKGVTPLPVAQRATVVHAVEELAASIEWGRLPKRAVGDIRATLLRFYVATFDHEGVARVSRALRDAGEEKNHADLAFRDAVEVAASGRVTDAVSRLAADAPEWWRRLQAVQLYKAAGDYATASEETLKLVSDWPGLSLIEHEAAQVHLGTGEYQQALFHSRRAYESLPGTGQRLTLAQCLIATGSHGGANELLQTLEHLHSPEVLRARALALDVVDPATSIPFWREYLAFEKADSRARIHLAALLLKLGRGQEAADEAWAAASSAGADRLSVRALYECALFQAAAPLRPDQMAERLRSIAEILGKRRGADPEAETAFLSLYFQLDTPKDLPPPDLKRLEDIGVIRPASTADVAKHLRAFHERQAAVWRAYAAGTLSFSYLCKLSSVPAAAIVASAATSQVPLSAPAWPSASRPVPLSGFEILVGQLELLVLHYLELLGPLEQACRRDTRLLLFDDVQGDILAEAVEVSARFHASTLERYTRLWAFLSSAPSVSLEKHPADSDDVTWATAQGVRIISRDPSPTATPPGAVAAWLGHSGVVAPALADGYRARFGDGEGPVDPGHAFAMDFGAVIEFDEAGLLEPLVGLPGIAVRLGPQATGALRARLADLEAQRDAAERARAVHEFVGRGLSSGWVEIITRPQVTVPPFRSPGAPEALRDGFSEALSWRFALLGHRARRLLSCDFLVTSLFTATTPVPLVSALAWTPSTYRRMAARARKVERRCLALPDVIAGLAPDAAEARQKLGELGFSSALQWRDIVDLARGFGGLTKVVPQRVLNGFERIARTREHPAARMTMLEVARRYAHCLWAAFHEGWSSDKRSSFVADILGRLESLESVGVGRPVETALRFFGAHVFSEPKHAFVPGEGERLLLSDESPAGKAWSFFVEWARTDRRRAAALDRGLQDAVLLLDRATAPEGPSQVQCAVMILALSHLARGTRSFSLTRSRFASIAILSSGWRHKPLDSYTLSVRTPSGEAATFVVEDVLASAASFIIDRFDQIRRDGETWSFAFPTSERGTVELALPPEAVLLRAEGTGIAGAARALAAEQGPNDGTAHDLLRELAKDPTSTRLRSLVARRGASSAWRAIRDDPTSLLLWGIPETAEPSIHSTSALLELLSEPGLIRTESIEDELLKRTGAGGSWEHRDDANFLLAESLLSTWPLALYECGRRVSHGDPIRIVEECLERLEGPRGFPGTHVAVDLSSAMLAVPCIPEEPVREKLRSRVVEIIERTILGEAAAPPADSFAAVEPRIVRECADAVARVCGPTIGFRDYVWLSRRLFQWFFRQLQFAGQDAVDLALAAFANSHAQEAGGATSPDVLDPRNNTPDRFNARLVTVLHGLNVGLHPEMFLARDLTGLFGDGPARLSEKTIAALGELASRPFTEFERAIRASDSPTQLMRWIGPSTVPDLALTALIRGHSKPLRQLPPDARRRWLNELAPPSITGASRMPTHVALGLMLAVAREFDDLSDDEVNVVRSRCVADLEWPLEWQSMRLLLLASLYDRGHADLAERIKAIVVASLSRTDTRLLLPALYEAAAKRSPDFLGDLVELVLRGIGDAAERVAAVLCVEKLVVPGQPAHVRTAARLAIQRNAELLRRDPQLSAALLDT